MDRRNFIAGTATLLPVSVAAQAQTLRDRVLGAWRILDAETVNVDTGATKPWLGRPRPYSGIIIYLPNGLMSVQIGAARPSVRVDAGFGTLTDDETRLYAQTWYAYYGHFEIDEQKSQVRHFVEGSLFAFETGTVLARNVRLDKDLLTLTTVNHSKGPDGDTFNRLTWTRA